MLATSRNASCPLSASNISCGSSVERSTAIRVNARSDFDSHTITTVRFAAPFPTGISCVITMSSTRPPLADSRKFLFPKPNIRCTS